MKRIDLGILLTIATTSTGLWIYLLQYIITLSEKSPTNYQLLPLGYAHGTLFLLSLLSIVSVYLSGLAEGNISSGFRLRVQALNAKLVDTMLQLWFPMLFLSILIVMGSYLISDVNKSTLPFYIVFISGLIALVFFLIRLSRKHGSDGKMIFLTRKLFIPFGFVLPYVLFMSLLFSDVTIKTDKEFYLASDTVRCSVTRSGYIFLPSVQYSLFQFYDTVATWDYEEISIPLDSNVSQPYISVVFRSQLFSFPREKVHRLHIFK